MTALCLDGGLTRFHSDSRSVVEWAMHRMASFDVRFVAMQPQSPFFFLVILPMEVIEDNKLLVYENN